MKLSRWIGRKERLMKRADAYARACAAQDSDMTLGTISDIAMAYQRGYQACIADMRSAINEYQACITDQ